MVSFYYTSIPTYQIRRAKRNAKRRARHAAKKAGLEVVRADDEINVARRADRKKTQLQIKLRQAVDQVARDHNLTVEDVVRSSITLKTTPNIHRAVEGNRVNTLIAGSVGGYDTLSAYGSILT